MPWHLAPSLAACRDEANRIAPNRSKVSDGTIGDAAHSARTSDHNPGARDRVHALDLTHDPAGGFDAHTHAERLRAAQDRRVKYLISNGRWAGPGAPGGGWHWRPYLGSNPHMRHIHISIHSTVAAETDTRPWWPLADKPFPPQEEDDMFTDEDRRLLQGVYGFAINTEQVLPQIVGTLNELRAMLADVEAGNVTPEEFVDAFRERLAG